MAGILNRTGDELGIFIVNEDGSVEEITKVQEIYYEVSSIKKALPYIIRDGIASLDYGRLMALASAAVKAAMKRNNDEEKKKIFAKKDRSRARFCEVSYRGKKFRFDYDLSAVYALFLCNEYDLKEDDIKGKVVVDAGANVGIFSLMCSAFGPKKIYAFEPVKETYDMLCENVRRNNLQGIVLPVNKALGDASSEATIRYDGSGDVGASITIDRGAKKTQTIEIVTLDSIIGDEEVGFIKMDVEGYEEPALLGASSTIKKSKPVLSFSAYHKPNDKTRLPEVLRSIRSDYSMKLNHFSDENFFCK